MRVSANSFFRSFTLTPIRTNTCAREGIRRASRRRKKVEHFNSKLIKKVLKFILCLQLTIFRVFVVFVCGTFCMYTCEAFVFLFHGCDRGCVDADVVNVICLNARFYIRWSSSRFFISV